MDLVVDLKGKMIFGSSDPDVCCPKYLILFYKRIQRAHTFANS